MRRVGKRFSGVETPLFEGMLVGQEIEEEGDTYEHVEDVTAVDDAKGDDTAAHGEVPTTTQEPSIPSPTLTIPLSQPPQDIPSTSQVQQTPPKSPQVQPPSPQPQAQQQAADFLMSLLQKALDAYAALTRRVEHLEYDKVAQALEITKLKRRVKRLEKGNKDRVLKLRRGSYALSWKPCQRDSLNLPDHMYSIYTVKRYIADVAASFQRSQIHIIKAFNVKSLFGEIFSPKKITSQAQMSNKAHNQDHKARMFEAITNQDYPSQEVVDQSRMSRHKIKSIVHKKYSKDRELDIGGDQKLETSTLGEIVSLEKSNKNGMLVGQEIEEEGDADEHVEDVTAGDDAQGDDTAAHGEVPTITQEPSIPSPTLTIPPS
nr:hypothetical protein [Tanacetum cinerariifolium]